ncbi:GAF domain-containing protein [Undibacterium sp. TJN25]|uniref:GAF domain-containing protein n=1 Tax=Undibacterium sp. TJN25 TaxID=3413056 RepID=UPI003BF1823A
MSLAFYLANSSINQAELPTDFAEQVADFQQQLHSAIEITDIAPQWQYQVPELGEGGSCSLFDQLASEFYDLEATLCGKTPANLRLLQQVGAVVQFYRQHSGSQWFGVYQSRINPRGESVLVKLAYFGAASRAEFPLTPEFAAISNNSTVGLSGKGRIINNVESYVAAGGEYYTCDPKVQAEACLPLLAKDGRVLGIIDSEAFEQNIFSGTELALLIAVATSLPAILAN